jgi:hypothetical protein
VQVVCDRVGRTDPIIIDEPFSAVTGGIQPDCLGDLIDDSREDGGAARVLVSFPDKIENVAWTEDAIEETEAYNSLCKSLWTIKPAQAPLNRNRSRVGVAGRDEVGYRSSRHGRSTTRFRRRPRRDTSVRLDSDPVAHHSRHHS